MSMIHTTARTLKTRLNHVTKDGKAAMVNVGNKQSSYRVAKASCRVFVGEKILNAIKDNSIKKGDVLTVSKIAGIMASKKTSDLIPLCHDIPLSMVDVTLTLNSTLNSVDILSNVECFAKTGVEMEALTAVSIAALTLYDMCKALSHDIQISDIKLEYKQGGKTVYNAKD